MCGWMDVYIIRTHVLPQSRAMTYVRAPGWVSACVWQFSWLKSLFSPSRIIVHWTQAFIQAESNWTYRWRTTANTSVRRLEGFNDTIPFDFILTFHAFLFYCHFYPVAFAARIGATRMCEWCAIRRLLVAFGRCQTHLIAPHSPIITHSRIEIEKMW